MQPNLAALRQVIRVLRDFKPDSTIQAFSLWRWVNRQPCGTTACACGLAGRDPWFIAQGFVVEDGSYGYEQPAFNGYVGWTAVYTFFRLTPEEASHLFSSSTYKRGTRTAVIRRIRSFIARHSS